MSWVSALQRLRTERRPGVLVTVAAVRGHAPREAGAKMVVDALSTTGTVGGGNLEETAVRHARALLVQCAAATPEPELVTVSLTEHAHGPHGLQCCGGEVTLLLEPLPVLPCVAVFGVGHVGLELARILARHDLDLHLVDSRADALEPSRLLPLQDARARVLLHHAVVPEMVIGELPDGAHVLVMTHDHGEDAALCDVALRRPDLASVGLIGSRAKWRRFERRLLAEGHSPEAVTRIQTPIGIPEITSKDPAAIAVAVAASLLAAFSSVAHPVPASGARR